MLGLQDFLAVASGSLVGFSLGLIGGGGSILAVPLLVYGVGVASPHVAIGTSAVAVAASAAVNLFGHARARTVKWPCAIVFALSGMVGAAAGAAAGKMVDGRNLLGLFGVLMIVVGLLTLRAAQVRRASGSAARPERPRGACCRFWSASVSRWARFQASSGSAAVSSSCPG